MIKVLVVDDDHNILEGYSLALPLIDSNIKLWLVDNVEAALEVLSLPEKPDIIVVDIMMPGLTGHQLVRAIRGDPDTANVGIIIISGAPPEDTRKVGMLEGTDFYLIKPVDAEVLVRTIHQAFRMTTADRLREFVRRGGETDATGY